MKWHEQVVHVARKDVRYARWLVAAYLLVVVVATLVAAGWLGPQEASYLGSLLVMGLGLLLLGTTVQADSPARTEAFWASRPLDPSAVLAAKLLVAALLVLGLPLVGQAVALAAHDLPAERMPALLLESAVAFGGWIAVAGAVAAVTPDLRSFGVVLLLLVFSESMLGGVVSALTGWSPGTALPMAGTIVIPAAWLLLLGHQYLTGSVLRGRWLVAALALVVLLLPPSASARLTPSAASPPAAGEVQEAIRPEEVRISALHRRPGNRVDVGISFGGLKPAHHYRLLSPVVLVSREGEAVRVGLEERPARTGLSRTPPPLDGEWTWLSGEPRQPDSYRQMLSLELSPSQRALLSRPGTRVVVRADLEVLRATVVGSLPLRGGAALAGGGRRIRVLTVENSPQGPLLELSGSILASDRAPQGSGAMVIDPWSAPAPVLVHRGRREALALDLTTGSGGGGGLVLPGARTTTMTGEFAASRGRSPGSWPAVDEEWLREAELVLFRWVSVGSYPVTLEGSASELESTHRSFDRAPEE